MRNLIPFAIAEAFAKPGGTAASGELEATALHVDIAGFTLLTQALHRFEAEGAEVVSMLINACFGPAIDAVYRYGGYIGRFSGDAFTAIYPASECPPYDAYRSAWEVQRVFETLGSRSTRFGDFSLMARAGLSYGTVRWKIVGSEESFYSYYYHGEPIEACVEAERRSTPDTIVADGNFVRAMGTHEGLMLAPSGEDHSCLIHMGSFPPSPVHDSPLYEIPVETLLRFAPKTIVETNSPGDFREVSAVFIYIKDGDGFDARVAELLRTIRAHGAYLSSLDYRNKGLLALVIFGALRPSEDLGSQALSFALALEGQGPMSVSICRGIVFAGLVGHRKRVAFACMGSTINLAARFVLKAPRGQIWVDRHCFAQAKRQFLFDFLDRHQFKNFVERIPVYRLIGERAQGGAFDGSFVGREKELRSLDIFLRPITQGRPAGLAIIAGEAGIGKSRLANEAISRVRTSYRLLEVLGDPVQKQSLRPLERALMAFFGLARPEPGWVGAAKVRADRLATKLSALSKVAAERGGEAAAKQIEWAGPFIAGLLGLNSSDENRYGQVEAKERGFLLFSALREFLRAFALVKPIIVIFDDYQWLDDDTLSFANYLCLGIGEAPIAIIGIARPLQDGAIPVFAPDLQRKRRRISLEKFHPEALSEFISLKLAGLCGKELVSLIETRTGGNPFLVEQLCLLLGESEKIAKDTLEWQLVGDPEELPNSADAILQARVGLLPGDLKRLAQIASLFGPEFCVEELVQLSAETDGLNREKTRALIEIGVDQRIWANKSNAKYLFTHALLRGATYDSIPKDKRSELHRQAARVLERLSSGTADELSRIAWQFEASLDFGEAARYHEKAGMQALESSLYTTAHSSYLKAIELRSREPGYDRYSLSLLHEKAGELCLESYRNAEAIGHFRAALDIRLSELALQDESLAILYDRMGLLHSEISDYEGALYYFSRALLYLGKDTLKNARIYARVYDDAGSFYSTFSRFNEAFTYFEKAEAIMAAMRDPEPLEWAKNRIGLAGVYFQIHNLAKAEALYSQAFATLAESGFEGSAYAAQSELGLGRVERAKGCLDKALERFETAKRIIELSLGVNNAGTAMYYDDIARVYLDRGMVQEALGCYDVVKRITNESFGPKSAQAASVDMNIGVAYSLLGRKDEALFLQRRALAIRRALFDPKHLLIARSLSNLGLHYYRVGEYARALRCHKRALAIYRERAGKRSVPVADCLCALCDTLCSMNKATMARTAITRAISLYRQLGLHERLQYCEEYLSRIDQDA